MKKAAVSLLITFLAATAHAGSFGGPPPFTNGSPLPTGNDGLYAASAHGSNLNGVFRFAFSSGSQASTSVFDNTYFIFVEGQAYQGDVQAMLGEGTVSGVLDNSTSLNGISASGYFSGKINQNTAYGSFSGKGKMSLVDGSITNDTEIESTSTQTVGPTTTTTTSTTNISTSDILIASQVKFSFKGVRTVTSSD